MDFSIQFLCSKFDSAELWDSKLFLFSFRIFLPILDFIGCWVALKALFSHWQFHKLHKDQIAVTSKLMRAGCLIELCCCIVRITYCISGPLFSSKTYVVFCRLSLPSYFSQHVVRSPNVSPSHNGSIRDVDHTLINLLVPSMGCLWPRYFENSLDRVHPRHCRRCAGRSSARHLHSASALANLFFVIFFTLFAFADLAIVLSEALGDVEFRSDLCCAAGHHCPVP